MTLDEIKTQILITGCYRTGSEYLTQLINSHPRISATFYTVNFMRFCFGKYDPIEREENWRRLIEDALEKLQVRYGKKIEFEEVERYLYGREVSYGNLYQALILAQYAFPGMSHWAEKTQLVWSKIPDFLQMYSSGKAIMIIRDPRSVLASFKRITNAPPPRYLGAIFNCLGAMQTAHMYLNTFPADRFRLVRYEDLASDTEKVMRELFKFLDFGDVEGMLSPEDWKDAHGQPWNANTAFSNDGIFSVQKSIDRWKENLSTWEIFLCEMVNHQEMNYWGYRLSNKLIGATDLGMVLRDSLKDEQIASFWRLWLEEGRGVECFPYDPLDRRTWEDVKIREKLEGGSG